MKYKSIGRGFLSLLVLFVAVSCATPPDPAPPPAEPPPVTPAPPPAPPPAAPPAPPPAPPPVPVQPPAPSQAEVIALDEAAARAAEARQLASDFEAEFFFPSEWDAAESLYSQADQQRDVSSGQAALESAERYNKAAEAFEALARKAIIAAFEFAEEELIIARDAAIAAGAWLYAPDLLDDADDKVDRALEKFDAGEYRAAKNYAWGAYALYTAIVVGIERERALEYRADVAARREFDPAEALFNRAIAAFEAQRFEEAAELFEESLPMFVLSGRLAKERRLAAEEALRRAEQRVAESEETAQYVDLILEGDSE